MLVSEFTHDITSLTLAEWPRNSRPNRAKVDAIPLRTFANSTARDVRKVGVVVRIIWKSRLSEHPPFHHHARC